MILRSNFIVFALLALGPICAQAAPASLPDREALQRAESVVRDAYPHAFDARADTVQLATESGRLRKAAKETRKPENRFVLLREASRLASEAGDLVSVLAVEDEIAVEWVVDTWARRADAVRVLAVRGPTGKAVDTIDGVGGFANLALAAGAPAASAQAANAACDFAARTRDKERIAQAASIKAHVLWWINRRRSAEQRLATDPKDRGAHRDLGMFLCVVGNDWVVGLEHLSQGGDAIGEAAQRDRASPSDPAEQCQLADKWLAVSKGLQGASKQAFAERAVQWYSVARPQLDAIEAVVVQRRLDEIARLGATKREGSGVRAVAPAKNGGRVDWGVGVEVHGWRTGTAPHKRGDCTLDGVIIHVDDERIEFRLRARWWNGGWRGGENIWIFKRTGFDAKTGKKTYKLDGRVDLKRRPTHASNFRGAVVIDGTSMKGEYRFDWTDDKGTLHEHRDADAAHPWELHIGPRPSK